MKKRTEELQLLMSSGHSIHKELQVINCLLDHTGGAAARQFWRSRGCRSGSVRQTPASSEENARLSSITSSLSSLVSEDAPWTRLILNVQDIFSLIGINLNIVTQQDPYHSFIIFCDQDLPIKGLGDICCTEDCRTSLGDTGWYSCDSNALSDLTNFTAHSPTININNSNRNQHDLVVRDSLNTSFQICDTLGRSSVRDRTVKKRKSVSFDDDVMVYLFDQDSPTMELHPEACTVLPEDTLEEDSGLEWDDDFSVLEKINNSCHFHSVTHSQFPLSRRLVLSQSCLFLTHVTEADLEL
ncbi:serine/threonine-protein kinase LMTK2-like isoform X1 [Plectropomus leopardus]|uniref:serine/threonine-protein kinase LMTK2-like isoform X1 n=1 Tax=Plectropomus leopardus TaxID=160734 RepID=UPI001C4DD1A4|nr:serine/threonine-protein kinase LMTK2-like isoform X1 [Plectropomus leopardus]